MAGVLVEQTGCMGVGAWTLVEFDVVLLSINYNHLVC